MSNVIYTKGNYTLYKFSINLYAISYEDYTICRYPIDDKTTIADDLAEFIKVDKLASGKKEIIAKEIKAILNEYEKVA